MQKCLNCHAEQFDGTIFCSECGASLVGQQERRETTASLGRKTVASAVPTAAPVAAAPVRTQATKGFCLVILNSGRRLELDAERDLLVGRKDDSRGVSPDIDLTDHGGYDGGVSRRHAILGLHKGICTVEDLGSANGTYINNRRVPPNQAVSLNDGDELKFGTLLLRVEMRV